MNPVWHKIHHNFKLNGISYSREELSEIGYSLIKEGNAFEISIGDFFLDWITDKPTLEVYTSGSTGKPKKIVLKKEHMVNSANATGEYFGLESGNSALLCLPCSSIAGKMMLVRAMVLGLELDYVEPVSTPLSTTSKSYDFIAMVPLQVKNSIEQLSRIKTVIIGGAPITIELRENLKLVSSNIFETYGMTETITHIAVKKITRASSDNFETLPHVNISKDDRDCLVIETPLVSDSKVVTNDIVELTDKTKFRWLGRYDSVINSGGVKLIPEQIEQKLSHVIESRFFVAGIPDESLGEKLILIVEDVSTKEQKLLQKIKTVANLGKYEIPKEIHFIEPFVETKSGKIQRKKILLQIG